MVLAAVAVAMLEASPAPQAAADTRRVCLALSGGGARGLAHVGVLEALEAKGIPIDCAAGTSMGALVASLYAAGYSPTQMRAVVRSLEWQDVFSGRPERRLVPLALRMEDTRPVLRVALRGLRIRLPAARDSDYRTNRLLFRLLAEPGFRAGGDFDRLRVPFRAVATDLASGERVVLSGGSLARAVRASLSTPVSLLPVPYDGRLLVDGGVVDNLPTGVARGLGADLVVAVDARSAPLRPRPADSFVDTAAVVADVLMRARNEQLASPGDVEIDLRPALGRFPYTGYESHAEAIDIGRRVGAEGAARVALRLPRHLPTARLGDGYGNGGPGHDQKAGPALEGAPVREVLVRGTAHVREDAVRSAFTLRPGRPFVMEEALRGMDEVYASRLFSSVWLDAAPAPDGGATLTVEVREAPRLALEIGGGYDESDQARGFLRLRNRNLLGRGERNDTTLLASLGEVGVRTTFTAERPLGLPVGVFTRGHVVEETPRFFAGRRERGRAEFDRQGLAAGLQRRLGLAGLLRGSLALETVDVRARPGLPFASRRGRFTVLEGEAAWDTLDDGVLPARGLAASLSVRRGVGASRTYWQAIARTGAAVRPSPRLVLRGQALCALSRDLPEYEQARLGGPVWIPGVHRDELWGAQAVAGALSAGVRVHRHATLVGRFGAGNVWRSRRAVSLRELETGFGLGVEVPTPAGPILLDWGRSARGTSHVQVSLGFPWKPTIGQ